MNWSSFLPSARISMVLYRLPLFKHVLEVTAARLCHLLVFGDLHLRVFPSYQCHWHRVYFFEAITPTNWPMSLHPAIPLVG